MSTILKWAGNKTAIMPELIKHLPAGQRLVEPFAGSCAVMMTTDYPHYLVADINPDLINLYKKSPLIVKLSYHEQKIFLRLRIEKLLITTLDMNLIIHLK